jgi:hypothetical protein
VVADAQEDEGHDDDDDDGPEVDKLGGEDGRLRDVSGGALVANWRWLIGAGE